jgi:hypothetical protein
MWLRLLKLAARHPLTALALALALALGCAASLTFALVSRAEQPLDRNARAVLGRLWFDNYPEKSRDVVDIWVWFGGGIGVHDKGSVWRSAIDFFDFERQNDKLSMVFLQDDKRLETRFKVTACDDKPPFDLCLDLTRALSPDSGTTRYYGFGDLDEMEARIPGSKALLKAAEIRGRGTRP